MNIELNAELNSLLDARQWAKGMPHSEGYIALLDQWIARIRSRIFAASLIESVVSRIAAASACNHDHR